MTDKPVVLAEEVSLAVLREKLDIDIQKYVTGVVRLVKTVRQYDTAVDEALARSTVTVEHVPVNLPLDKPAEVRQEGQTTIFPVMEEVLVLTKQLVLKEEIRVTRTEQHSRHQEVVPLLSEEVSVERLGPDGLSR